MWRTVLGSILGCGVCLGSSLESEHEAVAPAFDMAAAETHWAFVPLEKPAVPAMETASGNEVDAFLSVQLLERGVKPNGPTSKRSLIRRVTYDLAGLPPTFEEVQAFLADESSDAYERLVDRLLSSPTYGERWGRHWLDVARYADSEGRPNFRENRYKYAHTYRDYVIESFNADKPYDRFIMEQIAADQLDLGENKEELAALGFLTLGKSFFRRKDLIIDDQIDVITRGLQGLTVTCARCHDHKFDPIPTNDYYSLHGIFNSSEAPEELPIIRYPENEADYQAYLDELEENQKQIDQKKEETIDAYLLEQRALAGNFLGAVDGGKAIDDEEALDVFAGNNRVGVELLRAWIEYLDTDKGRSHPVLEEWFEVYAETDREAGIEHYNKLFKDAVDKEQEGLDAIRAFLAEPDSPLNPNREDVAVWIARKIRQKTEPIASKLEPIEWTHPGVPFRAHSLVDVEEPEDSKVYLRGNAKTLGKVVPRQYLEVLSGGARKPYSIGSGRLELARELASPKNPLTARVFVNRVWGWHMGSALVDTPSDFGVRTPKPIQLELLNWLSASFIESNWSIKTLHKRIVHSDAYKRSSAPNPESVAADPANTLWHHFPKERLDFESMRDTLLTVSGNLDTSMGGVQQDILDPASNRRTVYSYFDRTEPAGVFRTFDHPSPDATTPARFETIVPQQALFLMNSPFVVGQAKGLARVIEEQGGRDTEARIGALYRRVYQREPTEEEVQTGSKFLAALEASENAESEESLSGWELYAQAMLLSNELMFVD